MFKIGKAGFRLLTLFLFAVEFYIGVCVKDAFIRPYLGDFLVVILLFCGVMGFTKIKRLTALVGVLLFSYAVEMLQLINVIGFFRLSESKIARLLLGTSFSWADLLAYTLGVGFCTLFFRRKANAGIFK